jgi:hypothetical protein
MSKGKKWRTMRWKKSKTKQTLGTVKWQGVKGVGEINFHYVYFLCVYFFILPHFFCVFSLHIWLLCFKFLKLFSFVLLSYLKLEFILSTFLLALLACFLSITTTSSDGSQYTVTDLVLILFSVSEQHFSSFCLFYAIGSTILQNVINDLWDYTVLRIKR